MFTAAGLLNPGDVALRAVVHQQQLPAPFVDGRFQQRRLMEPQRDRNPHGILLRLRHRRNGHLHLKRRPIILGAAAHLQSVELVARRLLPSRRAIGLIQ